MKDEIYKLLGQYECGMNEAWGIAKEILELSPNERNYLFGYEDPKYIFRTYEPREIKEILNGREEREVFLDELELMLKQNGKRIDRTELERFYYSLEEVTE